MRQVAILVFLISYFMSSFAQNFVGWSEHLPYRKAWQLVASSNHVYCLTESGLFSYSLLDGEIRTYGKTNTLSDNEITAVGWSSDHELLILAYKNGNVDLLSNEDVLNISEIKNFAGFSDKQINSIYISEDLAYLSTNFGIVVLHLSRQEIADTYLIGLNGKQIQVNDVISNSSYLWAATENGLFRADLNSTNLADFNNWVLVSEIPNYNRACKELCIMDQDLFVLRRTSEIGNEIYKLSQQVWREFLVESESIFSISPHKSSLYVVLNSSIKEFNTSGDQISIISGVQSNSFRSILQIDDRTFIADNEHSLLEKQGGEFVQIKPDGPLRSDITTVCSVGKQSWASSGSINKNLPAELYLYNDLEWKNFTESNVSELAGKKDIISIRSNKRNESRIYAACWRDGLFEFQEEEFTNYYHSGNSPLGNEGINSMDSDEDGTLWIVEANSNNAVKALTYENEWVSLSYGSLDNRSDSRKIIALQNGDKWVLRGVGSTLFAFNENGTLANDDDDVHGNFTLRDENNSSISSRVYDIKEDQKGSVWVGTSSGIAVYSDPGNIFRDGNFFAYRPIISIEGSTQFLLSTEKVQCIEINGANQKWLGTEDSGAFLVSENGDEQLAHFTMENSPLPSNNVQQISANPGTGEVFFLTNKGMVSYRGKVTEGTENYNDLYVYPNPVRETYRGDIIVSGLMDNSTVKITNVSGALVWEGKSEGGQFIWDGRNFSGSRVHTGVYLIFCSNSDGSKSKVIKLLFIN